MSLTKRIFLDKYPASEGVRRKAADAVSDHIGRFTFRIPANRRNKSASHPHWDPFWPSSLSKAAKELGLETTYVNSGCFLRTDEDRAALLTRAEAIWRERSADYAQRLEKVLAAKA